MARLRVIVLEQEDARTFRYAVWADVPVARQSFYADPAAKSVWKDATVSDNVAIQNGAVVEGTGKVGFPAGVTLLQAQAALQDIWTAFQARINAGNPWVRYGSVWDGVAWTMTGVA